jgi:hypothetical protein
METRIFKIKELVENETVGTLRATPAAAFSASANQIRLHLNHTRYQTPDQTT